MGAGLIPTPLRWIAAPYKGWLARTNENATASSRRVRGQYARQ
jgi:hypothetical protein